MPGNHLARRPCQPRALFTALRQEKAVLANCLIDEVNNSYEFRPAACIVRAAAVW